MISFALAVYSVKALSSQLYLISILASFRYFDSLYLSINSLHIYFTAQNSIYNGNFLNCMDINSNSLYSWALFYIYSEIKIPPLFPLPLNLILLPSSIPAGIDTYYETFFVSIPLPLHVLHGFVIFSNPLVIIIQIIKTVTPWLVFPTK